MSAKSSFLNCNRNGRDSDRRSRMVKLWIIQLFIPGRPINFGSDQSMRSRGIKLSVTDL